MCDKTTTQRNRSIIFKHLRNYFSFKNILESFRVIIDLQKFWIYLCNRILLTYDITVSVKYENSCLLAREENWYHYHNENNISNIEDKKKEKLGKILYRKEASRYWIWREKIKNLYSWRNIKMYTIILIIAFFIIEMSIFYLCNGKDGVLIKIFNQKFIYIFKVHFVNLYLFILLLKWF